MAAYISKVVSVQGVRSLAFKPVCGIINSTFCWNQKCRSFSTTRHYSAPKTETATESTENPLFGHLLLIIPVAAFGLGTWQVQRRKWKLGLIKELEAKINAEPVPLPLEQSEIEELEYRKVTVQGEFDHSKELYILPRSLNNPVQSVRAGGGGFAPTGETGVQVVTPFHLVDKGIWILVNRGWVPRSKRNPTSRVQGQIEGVINLTGVVRLNEKRAPFTPNNDEVNNRWHFRDLEAMSLVAGTEPIMIDAVLESTVKDGPIGGQTRVSLRNEHMQYIITWYSLALFTGIMWYYGIFKKRRNILHKPKFD